MEEQTTYQGYTIFTWAATLRRNGPLTWCFSVEKDGVEERTNWGFDERETALRMGKAWVDGARIGERIAREQGQEGAEHDGVG